MRARREGIPGSDFLISSAEGDLAPTAVLEERMRALADELGKTEVERRDKDPSSKWWQAEHWWNCLAPRTKTVIVDVTPVACPACTHKRRPWALDRLAQEHPG